MTVSCEIEKTDPFERQGRERKKGKEKGDANLFSSFELFSSLSSSHCFFRSATWMKSRFKPEGIRNAPRPTFRTIWRTTVHAFPQCLDFGRSRRDHNPFKRGTIFRFGKQFVSSVRPI
jgi:hypothetical protein